MRTITNGSPIPVQPLKVIENPYFKVRIDAKVNEERIHEEAINWTRSTTCNTNFNSNYRDWVGLTSGYASNADLTQTINLPLTGHYLIQVLAHYSPENSGGFELFDGTQSIEGYKKLKDKYTHYSNVLYEPVWFKSGNHDFKITLTNQCWISTIIITPVIRYEGDNQENKHIKGQGLEVSGCTFTQNGIVELNQLSLTAPMEERFYTNNPDREAYLKFNWKDHLTVMMGDGFDNIRPMFGGYSFPAGIDQDDVLTIKAVDRLYDLQSSILNNTFNISPSGGWRSVYELGRYLATAPFIPLNASGVPLDFAVYKDFSTTEDFDSITVSNFTKEHDFTFGDPAPSLKLGLITTGAATAQLYVNTTYPYDAAIYDRFNLNYYYLSGSTPPFPFNIHVTMFKAGQTIASAVEYVIQFSGGDESNELTQVPIGGGGAFRSISVNLKELFNTISPSSAYYVTDITAEGTITGDHSGYVWLDQFMCYRELNACPDYSATDFKNYYDVFKDMCEKTNHIAFVNPGKNRATDSLIILPEKTVASTGVIEENELIEWGGWESDPVGDGFANVILGTFTKEDNSEGSSFYVDWESTYDYDVIGATDSLEAKNQADANKYAKDYVTARCQPTWGFKVKVIGAPEILPGQYVPCNLPRRRIIGDFPVKVTTYNYNPNEAPQITCEIDINRASRNRYTKWVRDVRSDVGLLRSRSVPRGLRTIGF